MKMSIVKKKRLSFVIAFLLIFTLDSRNTTLCSQESANSYF